MRIWKVLSRPFTSDAVLSDDLLSELDPGLLPAHVAMIMDGNGRWATQRFLPRVAGHRVGIDSVREVVRSSSEFGVRHLTLFAFSTENWRRPRAEVDTLMGLIREYIVRELDELHENGVRFRLIGRRDDLSPDVLDSLERAEAKTRDNPGLQFNVAISYSGRSELEGVLREVVTEVSDGRLPAEAITEEELGQRLFLADQPSPDLLIRTSGERRISNFLLWQLADAEVYFTETLWPDFRKREYLDALLDYQSRRRQGPAE